MTKSLRRALHTRRRFSTLCLASAASACASRVRRETPLDELPRAAQTDFEQQPGGFYRGSVHDSAAMRLLSERAARAHWQERPNPTPGRVKGHKLAELGPQRSIYPSREGLLVVSHEGKLGFVGGRREGYRAVAENVAVAAASRSSRIIASVSDEQRVSVLSSPTSDHQVPLPVQDVFPDFDPTASEVWVFSRFALVAYAALRPTDHDPDPGTAVRAYSFHQRGGHGLVVPRLLGEHKSSGGPVRVRPHSGGFVVVMSNHIAWRDWTFRCTADRFNPEEGARYRTPFAVATRGAGTYVVYSAPEPQLVTFPTPGAAPRVIELPFKPIEPSPLRWTQRRRPWFDYETPTAADSWTPLPGPDGRVALAPPGHIVCYDAKGEVTWRFERNGSSPAVLLDDGILVEHDAALFVLDWNGVFRHLWTAPSPITAQPLLYDRSWYVATSDGLYRLR